jgi:hypothetical protein
VWIGLKWLTIMTNSDPCENRDLFIGKRESRNLFTSWTPVIISRTTLPLVK